MDDFNQSGLNFFIVHTIEMDGTETREQLEFPIPNNTQLKTAVVDQRIEAGRAAWSALHTQRNPTREWFETEWKTLIPQGCGCSGSANQLLEQCPPRFDSTAEFFRWSVEFHNLVNRKLGKPEVTLNEARAIWRPTGLTTEESTNGMDDHEGTA